MELHHGYKDEGLEEVNWEPFLTPIFGNFSLRA